MQVSLAREIAFDTYTLVMDKGQKPEEVLADLYDKHKDNLNRKDRGFIKEIVWGSLRWHSKIYWILQNTSTRSLAEVTPEIRAALVCSTYQIFYMDKVPDRAAVNEGVEYVKKKGQTHAAGFVNGILRQIARKSAYFPKPDKEKKAREYLSLQYATPQWIVDRWFERFNFERMETILASLNSVPPLTVRINPFKTPLEKSGDLQKDLLREEKIRSERGNLKGSLQLVDVAGFSESRFFKEGFFTVQDQAAQLVGLLVDPKKGEKILDCCVGPAGKLGHIFELAEGQVELTAIERSALQIKKAQSTWERLGHAALEATQKDKNPVRWIQADFLEWDPKADQIDSPLFDKILIDAPCSGFGILRRHPEGKWQKEPSVILHLSKVQKKFIEKALPLIKPGGEIIYSVCSFEEEEADLQLRWVEQELADKIEIISCNERLPDYFRRYVNKQGLLTIFPGNPDGMDGFSAFIMKKL